MPPKPSLGALVKRLFWDLADPKERKYYGYWFIWQIPGLFGSMLRARYMAPRMRRAGVNLMINPGCRFRSIERLEVGDNVQIGFDNFFQARGGLLIGNNVTFAPGVKIWSVNHRYDDPDTPVAQQGHEAKPVRIGDNVFVGANAFILPGVNLSDGVVVCAGAVVGGKEYPPYAILAGNPARIIGYRGRNRPAVGLEADGAKKAS